MRVHQRRLLDKGKIEKLVVALRSIESANPEVAEKIRTEADYFETQRRAHALSQVPPPAPVCRLGRHRSRLQDRNRLPPQAVRDVLDGARRQRHHRPALLPSQRPVRGLLGGAPRGLTSTSMSHTHDPSPRAEASSARYAMSPEALWACRAPPSAGEERNGIQISSTLDCIVFDALAGGSFAAVTPYPPYPGAKPSPAYKVTVDGQPVFVHRFLTYDQFNGWTMPVSP